MSRINSPRTSFNLKRTDSVPSSSGIAVPPPLPAPVPVPAHVHDLESPPPTPSRFEALPSYTWTVRPPSGAEQWTPGPTVKSPTQMESQEGQEAPQSPVLSHTETFVNEAAGNGKPFGRTYIFRVIPSRIGVAFSASLMFVCSIGMAVAACVIANRLEGHLTPVQRLAIIFQILNYFFVTLASLVGLYSLLSILHRNAISPLARARKAATLFCGLLLGHLPFSVASGALSIHIVFKATTRAVRNSIQSAEFKAISEYQSSTGATAAAEGVTKVARDLVEVFVRSAAASTEGPTGDKALACWALEGSPLYWICKKNQLIKALIVILYLALWFLEVVALYAGTRYCTQLQSVEMIKNVDDEEAADY